jgi:pyrophosphatase PpaX
MLNAIKELTGSTDEEEVNKIWEAGKNREVPYPNDLLKTPKGVKDVLGELKQNYSLALVTSRIKESIYGVPQMAELEEFFSVAISAYDTKVHKPHPEPLLLAAEKLQVKPEESVYIGDVENDIKAAKAAGMKMILYSKDKIAGADYTTSSFKDLVGLVEKCNE